MNIPKISTVAARNLALSIGLASAMTCAAACHCNNKNCCDHFEKAKIEELKKDGYLPW